MNIKRKSIPKEQEKLFGDVDKLQKEGEELQIKIDKTLKKISDWKELSRKEKSKR